MIPKEILLLPEPDFENWFSGHAIKMDRMDFIWKLEWNAFKVSQSSILPTDRYAHYIGFMNGIKFMKDFQSERSQKDFHLK
ncbi:MAG: hypothetical protein ACRCWR_00900 [Saezia sp.]